jgi:hypothetical protein
MAAFTFNPQDFINPTPRGKNGLSSFAAYYQRLLYRELYPSNIWSPLDTWYDKQYYGKVDRIQNTVLIDSSALKAIKSADTPNLLAADFVVDAFEELAAHMRNAKLVGVCVSTGNSQILDMKAQRAYEDPKAIYGEYLNTVFGSFNTKTPRYTDKIVDFPSFVTEFTQHLKIISGYVPITLTNYLLTGAISGFSSGLIISIDTAPFDDDEYKYESFIKDPNYTFYVRSAKKFGLIVNKNAPWLLTADLFSEAAIKQFSEYGTEEYPINEYNFFSAYYNLTYLFDVPILKQYIINSYRSYVDRNAHYEKKIFSESCGTFEVKSVLRAPLAASNASDDLLSDKELVDLYLSLRSIEAMAPVKVTKKLKTELNSIYHMRPNPDLTGSENVAFYINLIYRDYIYALGYPALNRNVFKNLDNQIRTGKISTAGSIAQQLY